MSSISSNIGAAIAQAQLSGQPLTTNATVSQFHSPYQQYGVQAKPDSFFLHVQKADNGYVLHGTMNSPTGQTAKSFTRVVAHDGDLVGEIAALIATLKIS